jgi:hypothetical protein
MAEESAPGTGEEGDLFDRWLAHHGGEPAGQLRASTEPPRWAPRAVVAPAGAQGTEPETAELVLTEPAAEAAPVLKVVPGPVPTPAPAPARQPDAGDPPIRLTFRPRTRARTAVGVGTLLAAAAGVIGCYVAAREKDMPSIGIAVTLWILTGIIWAVHSGTSVTRLSVRGGQLQVVRQGLRTTIDLTSTYTPVEVHGRPGKHGWKVVFRRRDMSPFVIDQTMVDPAEFMRVLRYYRPGVEAGAE